MMTQSFYKVLIGDFPNVIAYLRSVIISKQQNILSLAMKKIYDDSFFHSYFL